MSKQKHDHHLGRGRPPAQDPGQRSRATPPGAPTHPRAVPSLVYADEHGEIFDEPSLEMAGASGRQVLPVDPRHLIPLPPGSDLYVLPDRHPLGFPRQGKGGGPRRLGDRTAVAAFVAPAYTRFLGPAFERRPGAILLPLYAYTAVGWWEGQFWIPAVRVDPDPRQDPPGFDAREISRRVVAARRREGRHNRLIDHLGDCAEVRKCPAARNYFLGRWEAPLPTSPTCNARCLGCISEQPGERTQTFGRIPFRPLPEEVAGIAVPHIRSAPRPVVSFGQGCEGEPLLVADLLEASVRAIRAATAEGIVNLNTNGSRPAAVARLCEAGLDSIRVSLPAVTHQLFERYTNPCGFQQREVLASLEAAHARGVHTALNYFVFPGVSDREAEVEALLGLCQRGIVDLIQLRNLNIDPDLYLDELGELEDLGPALGVPELLRRLRRDAPGVQLGYFNPYLPPGWRERRKAKAARATTDPPRAAGDQ